jgi:hypothetical protein
MGLLINPVAALRIQEFRIAAAPIRKTKNKQDAPAIVTGGRPRGSTKSQKILRLFALTPNWIGNPASGAWRRAHVQLTYHGPIISEPG